MKANLSRMLRSGVAMLLVLCMVAGFIPTAAFAATEPAKKYVSLGDSMANGYGLPGYDDPYRVNGFLDEVADSYPAQVAANYGWDLTPMATSAMRAEDLRYILEYPNGYQGDQYTKDAFINSRWNDYGNYGISEKSGVANVAKLFQTNVAEADVISLGVGNANFGVFMLGRLTNALGVLGGNSENDAWIDFQNALAECDADTKAFVLEAYEMLKAAVAERTPADAKELVDPLANILAYTIASYFVNYNGVIDTIVELNPDAEIMIVGLMNTFTGMKMSYNGKLIDMGAIMSKVIDVVNGNLAALPAVMQANNKYPEATFYYTAASNVSVIVDNFADEIVQANTVVRDRTIEEVVKTVWPMLNDVTEDAGDGRPYSDITRGDVEAYEAALKNGAQSYADFLEAHGVDTVLSIVTYIAFEKAIIEASKLNVLDANAFITLADDLDSIFDDIYDEAEKNLDAETAENDAHKAFAEDVKDALLGMEGIEVDELTDAAYDLIAMPDAMSAALVEDETVHSLLNLFARMLIGNGIGCHPSAAGHDAMTNAFIASYDAKHTVKDETIANVKVVLNELYNLVETYGPEVAAQVWAQWEEYGYVDLVETSISELKDMLSERYTYYNETVMPAINDSVKVLTAQKDALTVELGKLNAELAAKKAELAEVIANVEIGSVHTTDINIDVELGNNEQTNVPENDCDVDTDNIKSEMEAAVKDIEHAIATVEALLAGIEADIADMVALAEQIAAAVAELEKTMADLAVAAEDVEKAVNDVIDVVKNSDGVVDATVKSFEAARATAEAALEVLTKLMDDADEMQADVDTMIAKIGADAEALYNKFVTELPGCIEQIPEEAKMLIGGAVLAAQQAYEANKDEIYEALQVEIAKLEEQYEIEKKAVLEQLTEIENKIEAEINEKYVAIKAEYDAQIEAAKVEAAAKLEALNTELKGYQDELANLADDAALEVRDGIQAKIDRVSADIATVNADLEHAIGHLENAAQAAYDALVEETTKLYQETIDALNKKLEELKNLLDEAIKKLQDEAEKAIQALKDALDKLIAELEKMAEDLLNKIGDILKGIRDALNDVWKAIEEILKGNLKAIKDLMNALVDMGLGVLADAVDALCDAVMNLIKKATTADLVIDNEFKYIAIGDGSAASESYVEKLTEALNAEAAENDVDEIETVNYAKAGNTVAAERANLSDVTDADLITVGFSNVEFLAKAVDNMSAGKDLDWTSIVGEKNVHYIDELLVEVAAKIAESGMENDMVVRVSNAIEAYAYAAVQYATELPELVNDIHAANSEALVIIVGMYNPLDGVTIELAPDAALDIGEYVDYLVKGIAVHGVAYSLLTGNSIYVDAPAVQTVNTKNELGAMDLFDLIMTDYASLYPSTVGDNYIAAEICDALNITWKVSGLWGDADSNGVVNASDARLVLQYYVKLIGAGDLDLSVCDVDGNGAYNASDARLILQYYVKLITKFPVEQ